MSKPGKRYTDLSKKLDRSTLHTAGEALTMVKEMANSKFDETIELNMNLGLDVSHAEQQLRGTLSLPHGAGKKVTVIVFAEGDKAREATEAGADEVGAADLVDKIQKGWMDFDAAIATPDMMPQVGKLGKTLGPKGLMPNPKSGTVTMDVGKAVDEVKAGRLEYRTDKQSNVHLIIGKASFTPEQLTENYTTVVEEILRAKPSAGKGRYIKSVALSSTMGPSIKIDPGQIRDVSAPSPGMNQSEEEPAAL